MYSISLNHSVDNAQTRSMKKFVDELNDLFNVSSEKDLRF